MAILYVVGLGGTGGKIVKEFARQMSVVKKEIESKNLPAYFKVQIFDLAREPEIDAAVSEGLLSPDDVHVIPGSMVEARKYWIQQLASEKNWFPRSLVPEIPLSLRGERGVERRRPLARVVVHDVDISSAIYSELSRDLDELLNTARVKGIGSIVAVIVASLGGGFGSGVFHDIAALLRKAFEERTRGEQFTLYVFGVFILPYGYGMYPPPGVRSPFEEENSFAALRELAVLEALSERGRTYSEDIGRIGAVEFGKHYDGVFIVSYAGVGGFSYSEKFKEIDSKIAEFIRLLALIPAGLEEAKSAGVGIAISENVLKYKRDIENRLGLAPTEYRPILMSFNVASVDLGLDRLAEYFEQLSQLELLKSEIERVEEEQARLLAERRKLEEQIAGLEAEYRDCTYRWGRALSELSLSVLDADARKRIEETVKSIVGSISANPVEYGDVQRLRSYVEGKISRLSSVMQYLVLESVASELTSLLDELNAEYARKLDEYKRNTRILDDLARQRDSLPIIDKVFKTHRYREIQGQIETISRIIEGIEEELADIKKKRAALESIISSLRELADIVKPKSPEEVCSQLADRIREAKEKLEKLNREIESRIRQVEMFNAEYRKLEYEVKQRERLDKVVANYKHIGGDELLKRLFELWRRDPERFTKMTISDLLSSVSSDVAKNLATFIAQNIRVSDPMLANRFKNTTYAGCVGTFVNKYRIKGDQKEVIENGTVVVIGHPKDLEDPIVREALRKHVPSYITVPLESIHGSLKLIRIYPVVILHCTAEYNVFLEEYCHAKLNNKALYEILHVLPVDELVKELGLKDVPDPYDVDKRCGDIAES